MVWKKLFGRKPKDEVEHKPEEQEPEVIEEEAPPAELEEQLEVQSPEQVEGKGLFTRLKEGLKKTRQGFVSKVEELVTNRLIDEELFEELEDLLIQADVGMETTMLLTQRLRERVRQERLTEGEQLRQALQQEIETLLSEHHQELSLSSETPAVIMVVGVNGAGKTTTIGKLAYRLKQEGAKVVLGAGDTFRAAAIDQLQVWADRVGVDIITHQEGSDPAAVAYDTLAAARARRADAVILDTAGRLQTKTNLMKELGKVHRVVQKELGRELDEVLLVLDATTGQNALSQAKLFSEAVPITGIVLTKLDGTAKGGIVLALANELKLPVKLIGVGEKYQDLQDFDAAEFAQALFGAS